MISSLLTYYLKNITDISVYADQFIAKNESQVHIRHLHESRDLKTKLNTSTILITSRADNSLESYEINESINKIIRNLKMQIITHENLKLIIQKSVDYSLPSFEEMEDNNLYIYSSTITILSIAC